MKVLLISYDLKSKPIDQYINLYETIKKADVWWHYLESTWLVATELNPKEWYDKIVSQIHKNDKLLIIEVKPNYYGWLTPEAWEWIQKYLK